MYVLWVNRNWSSKVGKRKLKSSKIDCQNRKSSVQSRSIIQNLSDISFEHLKKDKSNFISQWNWVVCIVSIYKGVLFIWQLCINTLHSFYLQMSQAFTWDTINLFTPLFNKCAVKINDSVGGWNSYVLRLSTIDSMSSSSVSLH